MTTNRVSNAAPPKAASAQGPSAKNSDAASRFRESLAKAKSPAKEGANRKKPEARGAPEPRAEPFELRAEAMLVVTPYGISGGQSLARTHSTQAHVRTATQATAQSEQAERDGALAIENVRVGRAGDTVRGHATVGQGEHQGVELRAVEKNGRIEVELRAADSDAAQRLRGELASMRESLEHQGIERVSVSVVDASSEARGFSQGQSQRDPERRSSDDEPGDLRSEPARGRASSVERGRGDEVRDERDYLL